MYRSLVLPGKLKSGLTVGGFQNFISKILQKGPNQIPDSVLVFSQQDCFVTGGRWAARILGQAYVNCFLDSGEINLERGPVSDLAIHPDPAAALFDDSIDHCEAKPGALARAFSGEKRLKNVRLCFRAHSHPCVPHRKHHVFPRLEPAWMELWVLLMQVSV